MQPKFANLWGDAPAIVGKSEYIGSPMVTPGNRVYMVGHQDGSFPELGWHIPGEMGGIWDHPIKLMDGFEASITIKGARTFDLNKADSFTNFPFFNMHSYGIPEHNLTIERWQFVPDDREGMIVQYVFNNQGEPQEIGFQFKSHSDLRPTWLGERTNMQDGRDQATWNEKYKAWSIKDSLNPWYVHFGSTHPYLTYDEEDIEKYIGQGTSAHINYLLKIPAGESTLTFCIAGSYTSEEAAWRTYEELKANSENFFKIKKERYVKIANTTNLIVPDKELEQTFEWLKYNSDWLVRTVPEIGTGIGAGIPDYPWWFGVDSEYALQGYMAIGQRETVYKTIALLDSVSNAVNGNGRIIHEMSTNGAVFNEGNINETPQFATLLWKVYQWTGDKAILERYFPTIEKGLHWLELEKDANGNGFPDGFGMMEIHGMDSEMIDVASYTQKAFSDASNIAMVLGKRELAATYANKAASLKVKINSEFWNEAFQSYADFIGSDAQALKLIDDAIVRADTLNKPWAVKELEQTKMQILSHPSPKDRPFVVHHNWVVNTPMEVGLADPEKAAKALTTAEKFVNPYGVFVTGIDRDESAGNDQSTYVGPKVFSYTGAVMTLPTGVLAIAENNYKRPNQALNYLNRMVRTFSYALPGSMYEVSPDYGMMTQAWNIYSFAVPIVEQFFGIQPDAANKKVTIQPSMPLAWDDASLEHVPVGDTFLDVHYRNIDLAYSIKITQENPGWTLVVMLEGVKAVNVQLYEGEAVLIEKDNGLEITSTSPVLDIHYHYE